ncbi:MAG: TolB family protein [Solirubrobacterales bacterium]
MEMKTMLVRFTKCLAGVAAIFVLGFGAGTTGLAAAGPFSGTNGRLAVVPSSKDGVFLGTLTPGGSFHQIYEESDYDLAGSDMSFSPSGSHIALSISWRPSRLAIAKVSGGNLRYVNTHGLEVHEPFWARNGRIVFSGYTEKGRRSGTYSIRPDGSGLHKLFNHESRGASSDLDEFIATSDDGEGHYLELLDRNGKRANMLARNEKFFFHNAAFSPDGRWIVYERYPDPPGRLDWNKHANLFVVRRDGTHRRRLTTGFRDTLPAFSPDGRWVAFVRYNRRGYPSNVAALPLDRPDRVRRITHSTGTYYQGDLAWGRHQVAPRK